MPQQQLKQVLPNQNAGNANPGTATANPGTGNANPQVANPNAGNANARQRPMRNNRQANQNSQAAPGAAGTLVDPNVNGVGNAVNPAVGVDPGVGTFTNTNGLNGLGGRGFVVVSSDSVNGSFVRARLVGLMPGMSYTLAVHQLGDIGAVSQNSAGPIIAILGIVVADASGQTEVTFPVSTSVQPSLLLGRAVSLLAGINETGTIGTGGFGPGVGTFTNTGGTVDNTNMNASLAGTAITENTIVPGVSGVTNGYNYLACGVFGYASPARFNNNGVLIVP